MRELEQRIYDLECELGHYERLALIVEQHIGRPVKRGERPVRSTLDRDAIRDALQVLRRYQEAKERESRK